jgi:hypothetical protein
MSVSIRFSVALFLLLAPVATAFGQDKIQVTPAPNEAACQNMHPLTPQEAFEHRESVCSQLDQWGIYGLAGGGAMGGPGYKCSIYKKGWQLANVLCTWGPKPNLVTKETVARFAPVLEFDRAAAGYPMGPQAFFDRLTKDKDGNPVNMPGDDPLGVENTDRGTLRNSGSGYTIPTYYQVRVFGKQVRIRYWWFYGYQHPCFRSEGQHNGDWENVIVILREDRNAVAAVVYYQHGGWYTRIAGPRDAPCTPGGTGRCEFSGFRNNGEHPVVYVGKFSHGSFHDDNSAGPAGAGGCAYYGDFRNPASDLDWLRTWGNLVDLDEFGEPWMLKDYWSAHSVPGSPYPTGDFANWNWGPDGISNHPTQNPPPAKLAACEGRPTYSIGVFPKCEPASTCNKLTFAKESVGCYKSECLAGDDQASEDCLKECEPGYTNVGLTCNKGVWPWEWKIYGRLTGGHKYSYPYTLPLTDVGLSRRRNSDPEWDLP